MRNIDTLIIHCSATPSNRAVTTSDIRLWHMRDNGWRDIGYHYVIERPGLLASGRPFEHAGAHAKGHNANSLGICLVGGLNPDTLAPEANYTDAQWDILDSLVTVLQATFPIKRVIGHNEVSSKACPCFDVEEWLRTGTIVEVGK